MNTDDEMYEFITAHGPPANCGDYEDDEDDADFDAVYDALFPS